MLDKIDSFKEERERLTTSWRQKWQVTRKKRKKRWDRCSGDSVVAGFRLFPRGTSWDAKEVRVPSREGRAGHVDSAHPGSLGSKETRNATLSFVSCRAAPAIPSTSCFHDAFRMTVDGLPQASPGSHTS